MPAESRKAEIIAAALRLADELGPDRLTTQTVADAVGLTQPLVFRYFPTKQALWQAVGETMDEGMGKNWYALLSEEQAPEDRLRALILTQLAQIERTPAIPAILHSRELQAENPELYRRGRAIMMRFLGLLAAELERACGMGLIRRDLDPDDGALMLISFVQGLRIGIESDRVNEERRVWIACDICPEQVYLGEQAEIRVTVATLPETLLVPEIAIRGFDGYTGRVWTVQDGTATEATLIFGNRTEDARAQIIDGLPAGSEVVAVPVDVLTEGRRLRIDQEDTP